jgi:fibronectin-binding autotransporter adhesin
MTPGQIYPPQGSGSVTAIPTTIITSSQAVGGGGSSIAYGNLVITNNALLTVTPHTIVGVTGNLVIESGTGITFASGAGGVQMTVSGLVVGGGTITLNNNADTFTATQLIQTGALVLSRGTFYVTSPTFGHIMTGSIQGTFGVLNLGGGVAVNVQGTMSWSIPNLVANQATVNVSAGAVLTVSSLVASQTWDIGTIGGPGTLTVVAGVNLTIKNTVTSTVVLNVGTLTGAGAVLCTTYNVTVNSGLAQTWSIAAFVGTATYGSGQGILTINNNGANPTSVLLGSNLTLYFVNFTGTGTLNPQTYILTLASSTDWSLATLGGATATGTLYLGAQTVFLTASVALSIGAITDMSGAGTLNAAGNSISVAIGSGSTWSFGTFTSLSGGTLTIAAGSTLAVATSFSFLFATYASTGTLSVSVGVTLTINYTTAPIAWTLAAIAGAGTLSINNSATIDQNNASGITLSIAVINGGAFACGANKITVALGDTVSTTTAWTGTGTIAIGNSANFVVGGTQTWAFGTIQGLGKLTVNAAMAASATSTWQCNTVAGTGTVTLGAGVTLTLQPASLGGATVGSPLTFTDTGSGTLVTGATTNFVGYTSVGTTTFTPTTTLSVTSGTLTLAASYTLNPALTYQNTATVSVAAGKQITVGNTGSANVSWGGSGGTLTGPGTLNIPSSTTFTVAASSALDITTVSGAGTLAIGSISVTIDVSATPTWTVTNVTGSGNVITNGTLTLQVASPAALGWSGTGTLSVPASTTVSFASGAIISVNLLTVASTGTVTAVGPITMEPATLGGAGTFDTGSQTITVATNSTWSIQTVTTHGTETLTINTNTLTLQPPAADSNTYSFTFLAYNGTGTLSVGGAFSGYTLRVGVASINTSSGTLTLGGAGALFLGLLDRLTLARATTLSIASITGTGTLATAGFTVTVGAKSNWSMTTLTAASGTLTVSGGATLTLNVANNYAPGWTTYNGAGALAINDTLTIASGATLGIGTISGSGTLALGGNAIAFGTGAAATTVLTVATITGDTGALTVNSTYTLSLQSGYTIHYSGITATGTLQVSTGVTVTWAIAGTISGTGFLNIDTASDVFALGGATAVSVSVSGSGTLSTGAFAVTVGAAVTWSVTSLTGSSTLSVNNTLTVGGTPTWAYTGTFQGSGTIAINVGITLSLTAPTPVINTTTVNGAGTLALNANAASIGSTTLGVSGLTGSGSITFTTATTVSGSPSWAFGGTYQGAGSLNITGTLTLTGGATLSMTTSPGITGTGTLAIGTGFTATISDGHYFGVANVQGPGGISVALAATMHIASNTSVIFNAVAFSGSPGTGTLSTDSGAVVYWYAGTTAQGGGNGKPTFALTLAGTGVIIVTTVVGKGAQASGDSGGMLNTTMPNGGTPTSGDVSVVPSQTNTTGWMTLTSVKLTSGSTAGSYYLGHEDTSTTTYSIYLIMYVGTVNAVLPISSAVGLGQSSVLLKLTHLYHPYNSSASPAASSIILNGTFAG